MPSRTPQGDPSHASQESLGTARPTDKRMPAHKVRATEHGQFRTSDLLSMRAAAAYLTISIRSLWTLTNSGAIPVVRIGRCVRVSRAALDAYIRANTTGRGGQS